MVKKARPVKVRGKDRATAANGRNNGLHLKVPDDNIQLQKDGLLAPVELDDVEAFAPLDFTSASSRVVGQQYSAWTVRFSYLVYLVGKIESDVGRKKHDLKMVEARWRRANIKKFSAKYKADDEMWRDKKIRLLRTEVAEGEAGLKHYGALLESYRALREAASREITRRTQERAPRD